jgi:acyl-CoA synthetase (NDP forming)
MTTQAVAGCSYALLADGATVEIRPASPDDTDAVTRFHQAMSPDNLYLRFFSMSKREAGLSVTQTDAPTQARLRRLLSDGAAVAGPVDTTAAVGAEQFRDCLLTVAEGPTGRGQDPPDAVIALVVPTAASDLVPTLQEVRLPVPLAAVVLGQGETVRMLPAADGGPAVPAYAYPEGAAGALGRAARYSAWRSRPAGTVPGLAGLRPGDARALVGAFLGRVPGGGWLSPGGADELLRCYGVPVVDSRFAVGTEAVLEAAAALGGHVALKADVPGLVHKSDADAVVLDLRAPGEVRRAMRRLEGRFGDRLSGVLVQPMVAGGTEVIIGVVQEPVFGPLVMFGLGGVATDVLGDHAARLAPLTGTDADDLIRTIRAAPLLLGHRGQPAADIGALRDTLLRISRLADDLPQVTELDLNPVIARPDGVFAVDARVRVTSRRAADPFLRQLRLPPAATQKPEPEGEGVLE